MGFKGTSLNNKDMVKKPGKGSGSSKPGHESRPEDAFFLQKNDQLITPEITKNGYAELALPELT